MYPNVTHKTYFQYWGKAQKPPSERSEDYHLLVYHSLDVSAVGYMFLQQNPELLNKLAKLSDITSQQFHCWFTFMLALHTRG